MDDLIIQFKSLRMLLIFHWVLMVVLIISLYLRIAFLEKKLLFFSKENENRGKDQ
jgi:hypothetical protein